VSPLEEDVSCPHPVDASGRLLHPLLVGDGHAGKPLRLRDVRGEEIGAGEEALLEDAHGPPVHEGCAPLGDHHRVDDQDPLSELGHLVRNGG
jgi:hypothetical protein